MILSDTVIIDTVFKDFTKFENFKVRKILKNFWQFMHIAFDPHKGLLI